MNPDAQWLLYLAFATFLIVNAVVARTERERSFARNITLAWFAVVGLVGVVFR